MDSGNPPAPTPIERLDPTGTAALFDRVFARTGDGIGLAREGEDPEAGLGASWLYLSDHDGRLLATELAGAGSAGDVFVQAQFPLHSGKLLGLPGRVLISASGLVVALLSGTGVYVWAVKRSARRAGAGSRTSASALEADPS